MIHTCCTATQSSGEGSTPSLLRTSLALVSPSLLLNRTQVHRLGDKITDNLWSKLLTSWVGLTSQWQRHAWSQTCPLWAALGWSFPRTGGLLWPSSPGWDAPARPCTNHWPSSQIYSTESLITKFYRTTTVQIIFFLKTIMQTDNQTFF